MQVNYEVAMKGAKDCFAQFECREYAIAYAKSCSTRTPDIYEVRPVFRPIQFREGIEEL